MSHCLIALFKVCAIRDHRHLPRLSIPSEESLLPRPQPIYMHQLYLDSFTMKICTYNLVESSNFARGKNFVQDVSAYPAGWIGIILLCCVRLSFPCLSAINVSLKSFFFRKKWSSIYLLIQTYAKIKWFLLWDSLYFNPILWYLPKMSRKVVKKNHLDPIHTKF